MTQREAKKDMLIGIAGMVLAMCYYAVMAFQVNSSNDTSGLAGRQLPILAFFLLLFFSGGLAITSFRKLRKLPADAPVSAEKKAEARGKIARVAAYVAMISVYALAFNYIGFIVSSVFALAVFMWFSGCTSKLGIVLVSIFAPIVTWLIFAVLVETPMPDGLLI
ncbi:MAG: tripartite tricarboxylate transporter TctB family protein [Mailhella sp.]|nr:tripartite tricarboxylate transporter TctB family protein [Mailhella sp.]